MKLLRLAMAALLALSTAAPVSAHGPHRPRIGVKHDDVLKATENWGTYCITELAGMFREAVALNIKSGISPEPEWIAATDAGGQSKWPRVAVSPGVTTTGPDLGVARETPIGGAPGAEPLKKASPPSGKITVITAKKFVTMDPGWPEATAVAVADGKILSVGVTFDDLKPWLDKHPYEVDDRFKDKVIYPGFVEAHARWLACRQPAVALLLPHAQSLWQRNPGRNVEAGGDRQAQAISRGGQARRDVADLGL